MEIYKPYIGRITPRVKGIPYNRRVPLRLRTNYYLTWCERTQTAWASRRRLLSKCKFAWIGGAV